MSLGNCASGSLIEQPGKQSIELVGKSLHVSLAERLGTDRVDACRAKLFHQVSSSQSLVDASIVKKFTTGADSDAVFLNHTRSQGDIAGDHNVARLHLLDNRIVRYIGTVVNGYASDEPRLRNGNRLIGHQNGFNLQPIGGSKHDFLDRYGAGVRAFLLSLPGISSSHGRCISAAPHSLGNFDRRVLHTMFGKKEKPAKREGFIKRLRARINKGDSWLTYDLANLVPGGKIDEDSLDELESLLVMADVGIDTTTRIIEDLQKRLARKELTDLESLRKGLQRSLVDILGPVEQPLAIGTEHQPFVILMVGVNGAGKTTTIGKLAKRFQDQGLSVMLAAGDTFRAAAVEQLQVWGERNDVPSHRTAKRR